jgi:hypothetical protein
VRHKTLEHGIAVDVLDRLSVNRRLGRKMERGADTTNLAAQTFHAAQMSGQRRCVKSEPSAVFEEL